MIGIIGQPNSEIHVYSKDGKRHFGAIIYEIDNTHYYVFDMPLDDERKSPNRIKKLTLNSKEEVEAFFSILKKLRG